MRIVDGANSILGRAAAWLFVATGAMLTWEVSARYILNAPTVWAAELSQLAMAAAVFFALGDLQRRRRHITVRLLRDKLNPRWQRSADVAALLAVAAFAAVVVVYGAQIAWRSFSAESTSGTILNLPKWWGEVSLPFGFFLLFAQSLAELPRAARGDEAPPPAPELETREQ